MTPTHIASAKKEALNAVPSPDIERAQADKSEGDDKKHQLHAIHLEPKKRLKTFGEKAFNTGTYIGVGLLFNEYLSPRIATAIEHGSGKNRFDKFQSYFTRLDGKKLVPDYVGKGHLPRVLLVLIGGTLIVPIIKWLEDAKTSIVHWIDRKHYGDQVDTDPAIVAAHKEMDDAPKQTWGSLLKARVTVMFTAVGVDALMGWKDAPTTKLFKDNPTYQKYSSMQRIAEQVSQKMMNTLKTPAESRLKSGKFWESFAWCTVLSTTMVALFYATSRIFARKQEERVERREQMAHTDNAPETAAENALATEQPKVEQRPKPQVSAVAHAQTLAASAPQLVAGA